MIKVSTTGSVVSLKTEQRFPKSGQMGHRRRNTHTDRAVSKWERGICAPDLALLEPLADILEISITELITGELEVVAEHKEELEHVVKETIQYSKQEITNKKNTSRKKIVILVLASILLLIILVLFLLHKGFFHKIGTYPSPDGTTKSTVYNCNLHDSFFPTSNGFTVENTGYWNGSTCYLNAKFRGMWWSPDSKYRVVSMNDTNNKTQLALVDYTRNCDCNLTVYLEMALYEKEFFSEMTYDDEGYRPQINFEFIQWSDKDPAVMLVYFSYEDINENFREGYMWYDYESGALSGEMELEQGKKKNYWLHGIWDGLY